MRKILFIVLLLSVLGMQARTYSHDFGTIKEDGGVVKHRFQLDASREGYSIVRAYPGCPCVTVDYPKLPVKPGIGMTVTLNYDPKGQNRHFTKSVYIRRSDGVRDTLVVTGTVQGIRGVADKSAYPFHFGMGLYLKSKNIDFGRVRAGEKRTLTVPLINAYEAGMHLDLSPAGPDASMVSVPYGKILHPLDKSEVKVELNVPKGAKAGRIRAWLVTTINSMKVDSIPISGVIAR